MRSTKPAKHTSEIFCPFVPSLLWPVQSRTNYDGPDGIQSGLHFSKVVNVPSPSQSGEAAEASSDVLAGAPSLAFQDKNHLTIAHAICSIHSPLALSGWHHLSTTIQNVYAHACVEQCSCWPCLPAMCSYRLGAKDYQTALQGLEGLGILQTTVGGSEQLSTSAQGVSVTKLSSAQVTSAALANGMRLLESAESRPDELPDAGIQEVWTMPGCKFKNELQ